MNFNCYGNVKKDTEVLTNSLVSLVYKMLVFVEILLNIIKHKDFKKWVCCAFKNGKCIFSTERIRLRQINYFGLSQEIIWNSMVLSSH